MLVPVIMALVITVPVLSPITTPRITPSREIIPILAPTPVAILTSVLIRGGSSLVLTGGMGLKLGTINPIKLQLLLLFHLLVLPLESIIRPIHQRQGIS